MKPETKTNKASAPVMVRDCEQISQWSKCRTVLRYSATASPNVADHQSPSTNSTAY